MLLTDDECRDLAHTLFSDAFESGIWSQYQETDDPIWGALLNDAIRPQEDICLTVASLLDDHGVSDYLTESCALVRRIEAKFNDRTGGKLTLAELYRYNASAAHSEILGAVGHGVSADDDREVRDWIKAKGIDPSLLRRLYFESPWDSATTIANQLYQKLKAESEE